MPQFWLSIRHLHCVETTKHPLSLFTISFLISNVADKFWRSRPRRWGRALHVGCENSRLATNDIFVNGERDKNDSKNKKYLW